ncbi:MAG: hypothetical protein ACRDZQ_06995 [Acidimicrobiales bacterium]
MPSRTHVREELAASLAARRELGEEYEPALVESFLDNVARGIDARVDARVAEGARHHGDQVHDGSVSLARQAGRRRGRRGSGESLALWSIALGIPVSGAIGGTLHGGIEAMIGIVVAWGAIATINVAHALGRR